LSSSVLVPSVGGILPFIACAPLRALTDIALPPVRRRSPIQFHSRLERMSRLSKATTARAGILITIAPDRLQQSRSSVKKPLRNRTVFSFFGAVGIKSDHPRSKHRTTAGDVACKSAKPCPTGAFRAVISTA
jgi:hypothetical protein